MTMRIIVTSFLLSLSSFAYATTETGSFPPPADSTPVISRHLSDLADSPYNRALKSCFKAQFAAGQQLKFPVQVNNPELIVLIACSPAMAVNEKQYWFDIYPEMTLGQKERLFDTLSTALLREIDSTLNALSKIEQAIPADSKADNDQH